MSYCTVFALLYFECEGYFPSIGPRGWYLEGLFIGGFFCVSSLGRLYSEGLHGGACFRNLRHLFDRKVTGFCKKKNERFFLSLTQARPWKSFLEETMTICKPVVSGEIATVLIFLFSVHCKTSSENGNLPNFHSCTCWNHVIVYDSQKKEERKHKGERNEHLGSVFLNQEPLINNSRSQKAPG